MAYQDLGFDEFLNPILPSSQQGSQQLDPLQFDSFTDQISGSKLQGGVIATQDGKIKLDLDTGFFQVNNGLQDLVTLGVLPDGKVGLLVKDSQGNILMQVSEGLFFLQSADKVMTIDMIAAQTIVRDAQQNIRVLLGKYDA